MARKANNRIARVFTLLVFVIAGIYGLGLFLTSSATTIGGLDYHAGQIEANSNKAVSTGSSASSNTVFTARRIAVLLGDDHPVLNQASAKLREDLIGLDYVDEVDVFPSNEAPEFGGRLYDAYLKLSIEVQKDSKPFVDRDFVATIHFSAGTLPHRSQSGYADHLTPPQLRYSLTGEIDHTSKSTQIGTPYKLIADNIAEELSGSITDNFAEWDSAYGTDFEWPQELIGQYPQDLTIPWPDGVQLDPVVDGYGLMRYRDALWTTETDNPRAIVQAFHQTYTDAGWRIDSGAVLEEDEQTNRYHFRAWNGSPHEVEVFEVRDGYGERKHGEVSRVCVRYQHRFDQSQTREIIDSLLESDDNLEAMGCLTRQMTSDQSDRYYQSLVETKPTESKTLIDLARYSHRKERIEEARRYLMRAYLNAHRVPDHTEMRDKIKKAAKEMGIEDIAEFPLTAELLAEFGYQSAHELDGTHMTVRVNEAVLFHYESDGKLYADELWISPVRGSGRLLWLNHYSRSSGGPTNWGGGGDGERQMDGRLIVSRRYDSDRGAFSIHWRQREDDEALFDVEVVAEPNP